ncbi:MAG: hypothetical protein HYR67_10720 [Bacteroidetes bacterium]|nr:hypothetical protein [Bacteroidota bacterium]
MEQLFWDLYNSNSEEELSFIFEKNKILKNPKNWKPYGGRTGNFGTFESQQNHPVPALIEKITNSIDAILIKECKLKGIDPKSTDAPKTMSEAVELFYNVKNGEIGELSQTDRRKLAENIQLIAVGDRIQPSLVIYDDGEGQNPEDFENTFLSLHANNKTSIHFVQGKYNMGSTGAVVFCGDNKFQLIASKRNTALNGENDKNFGFTLVRRHPLTLQEESEYGRATWYEYFSPNDSIASFEIKELDLGLFNRKFISGSIVKLYSYQLPRGSRSDVTLDLWRDLNQYMYHLPLPISVYEKRDYAGKTPNKLVLGNRTRITIDSRDLVAQIVSFNIPKESGLGEIPIEVIIFKNDVDHGEFIKNKSIIFTKNGQVHGYEGQSFISQSLGFSLLKKYTLIHVDCTNIPTTKSQDIFMSNRTHLKYGTKATELLIDTITDVLKRSSELRKLNNDRRNSLLQDSGSDKDLLEKFLSKLPVDKDVIELLKRDGSLNFLKQSGNKINSNGHQADRKKLNRFPSIFKLNLKKDNEGKTYRTIPLNSHGSVTIETDVENDYLFRPSDKGKFEIQILQRRNKKDGLADPTQKSNPNVVTDILTINREGPVDGTIKLLIEPNAKAKVGDEVQIRAILSSPGKDFECVFDVKVDEEISKPQEKASKPTETFPNLPTPRKAFEKAEDENSISWSSPELNWTGNDIVKVITSNDNNSELMVDGIVVNMDSFVLKNFLSKNRITNEREILFNKDKYFLSIYLHSLFLFSILSKMRREDEKLKLIEVDEFISSMIKPYSSFLMYENYHITNMAFEGE